MRGTSGPTARNHPRIRRWVVGWSPRHPPVLDVDPRGLQTSRNPAPRGRISPVFWPLRCKVEGGWGGSAHYPDPTAQSAPAPGAASTPPEPVRAVGSAGPGAPGGPVPRSPPPLLAGLVDLAAAARGRGQGGRRAIRRRGPTAWDSRPIPCPGLGLTTARVSRSLKAGLEPTGISMSSVRTVVPS